MTKKILFVPLLALAFPVAAQHTEIIGRAGLGLMCFGGQNAIGSATVNYSSRNGYESGYTNSPYGSKLGAGVSLGVRAQRVGQRKGLLAFDLGYDWLQSRTNVAVVNYYNGQSNMPYDAKGTTYLQTKNLTAFLGVGHRFELPVFSLDVVAGPEMAYVFGFHERGSGTFDGGHAWATSQDRSSSLNADARLRADATAWFHRVGATVGYSHGFLNYQGHLFGGSSAVYSRTLRLGLAYRLR
jgi:hypothetical protein